jgi:hypothetical protein
MKGRGHFTWTVLLIACVAPIAQAQFTQACQDPKFPSPTSTVADASCPALGNGGAEGTQNQSKNNFCSPTPVIPISFRSLQTLQTRVEQDGTINFGDPPSPNPGPTTNRTKLRQIGEDRLVSLIGYVFIARQEGKESVNCGSNVPNAAVRHDIHISLVAIRRETDECHSVVVEMSPHHRPPDWTAPNVEKLAHLNAPVRVIGHLLFDSSHLTCASGQRIRNNPSRFSLWEIHPIYKFQVCTADCGSPKRQWVDLSDWVAAHAR